MLVNDTAIYVASYAPRPISESRQPYTKSSGLNFANATSGFTLPTGTGVLVHLPGSTVLKSLRMGTYTRPISSKPVTSLAGRLPYTKFASALSLNTTPSAARPIGAAVSVHPSGTGFPFSPSGKPTAAGNLIYHSPPPMSGTGHLPYRRSAGAMLANKTSGAAVQTASGVFYPSGTKAPSGCSKPSGSPFHKHIKAYVCNRLSTIFEVRGCNVRKQHFRISRTN